QERPEHYERRQVGVGLGRQTHFGAGRPIKHPRWNLQPTVRVGCSQVAAKDNSVRPLNCLISADPQAGPWMPRIQQLPKLGPVGVLKPCCTTRFTPTRHSDIVHPVSSSQLTEARDCVRSSGATTWSFPPLVELREAWADVPV